MKYFNWLVSKIRHVIKYRLERKTMPMFEQLIQMRIDVTPVDIRDYLLYEHYSFDDTYSYREPNQACMFMIVVTDNQEVIFIKRSWGGEWLKVIYHTDQLVNVLSIKIKLISIGRKIRKLSKS